MASSVHQSQEKGPIKREMTITPFGSQLDDINKALFDYRYRKQTQHHHHQNNNNNNKFYNGGVHHQKNQMRPVSHHHHQHGAHHNFPNHVVGGNVHVSGSGIIAADGAGTLPNHNLPTPAPTPMTKGFPQQQVPQLAVQQAQQLQNPLLQHPKPHVFQQQVSYAGSGNQQQHNGGGVFQSVVAASPDSFVEELVSSSRYDPFVRSTNLSSSVSSGGGSTVSYGSNNNNDNEILNNKEFFNVNVNVPNEFLNNNNNIKSTNANNVFNSGFDYNDNNNNRSDKNFGWLKIWGNDMSVWG